MTQLSQTVILITGASGGFGQELTKQLLAAGSRLILTDIDETVLRQRVTEIQQQVKTGEVLACLAADLSTSAGCETLYHQVKTLNIPVEILINNAGIGLFGRMDEVPQDKWERLMQVNLLSPMRLSALFAADMITRRQGHIVNISSLAGWSAINGLAHYSASKFGLRGFSEGLYQELKDYNVKVTAVYPFFSRTPILESERFGTLAKQFQGFPEDLVTDPADVMRATIQGIICNQLHVFPDKTAKTVHLLKRYFPRLLDWVNAGFGRRLKSGDSK
ncbi:short-chain dehydrogenase [Nostoc sp. CENA543]|uniref:SDR family NAD(P)-dependent oxidoreductase n=1 Tax=Nostoc sp. CENA543 TaxID=1869241 RepID=UPI000CA29556|nr:SDR family NAD(P)-dependent oxidoreductase [Nostoc sp. CENA543]AUT02329.1 short-chain dehydrogenase [Nostoc sp. CENA543]